MSFKWDYTLSKAMLSCVALFGLSTNAFAAKEPEKKPNFAFSYPKDLCLTDPRDFYFYVEGVAFQGAETGLDFAIINNNVSQTAYTNNPALQGSVFGFTGNNEDWGYNFGTRIGFGVNVDHDAWNFDFDWLWVNVTNSNSFSTGTTGATILPIWLPLDALPNTGTNTNNYQNTSGHWQCIVNVVDATLGKPYYISRKVIFNPHFGLRFAQLDQDFGVSYGNSTVSANQVKFQTENDFIGVGARVGINTDWLLGCGFKLFSNVSASALAGWFDTTQKFTISNSVSTPDNSVNLTNNPQAFVPNLELNLGLDWGTYLDKKQYYLDFRAGYEFQVWWDQLHMRQFVTSVGNGNNSYQNVTAPGNLTLSGFTFKIQLDM